MNKLIPNKWAEHHKRIEGVGARPLLIESLHYVKNKSTALDLGAGILNDSEFLITQDFKKVIAVDIEPSVAERKHSKNIEIVINSFETLDLPHNKYDLISSQWSLPFTSPHVFDHVMEKIYSSLKKEEYLQDNCLETRIIGKTIKP